MPFTIRPLTLPDLENLDRLSYTSARERNDLLRPVLNTLWPVQENDELAALTRLRWSNALLRNFMVNDLSARVIAAVDVDIESEIITREMGRNQEAASENKRYERGDEIAGILRWHLYERGYPDSDIRWEAYGPTGYAEQMRRELGDAMFMPVLKHRQEVLGQQRCWLLAMLAIRPSHQGRGAGTMLVQWGQDQARRERVPAYTQAGPEAWEFYKKCGFVAVADLEIDLTAHGKGVHCMECLMWREVERNGP